MGALLEKDLYGPVESYLRHGMGCWESGQEKHVSDVGRIDVLGARYVGGDLSGQSEIIAVEVKLDASRFALAAGQAHGYSVAADRCYLAVATSRFTPSQVAIASHLGVGLIRIRVRQRLVVDEVLTAPVCRPIEEHRFQATERLGLAFCSLCRTLFPRDDARLNDYKGVVGAQEPAGLERAAAEDRGLMWWLCEQSSTHRRDLSNGNTRVRRYLCPSCVYAMAPHPVTEQA